MEISELIGLDVGERRTGIARASSIARLAEPLKTVETQKVIEELENLLSSNKVSAVVVGLPRSLNGEDTEQTRWVRDWAKQAKQQLNTTFFWQDEALTSKHAEVRAKKEEAGADAIAAQIILQDFLDTPESERIVC